MTILSLPPEKRTCLITGCSSGIGYQTAVFLKEKGVRVFATARKMQDVRHLKEQGFESYQCDMDDSRSIQQMFKEVLKQTDHQLYAVFNNAGFSQPGAFEDLRPEILKAQFETNLMGILELTNLALPVMRKQGYGRVIQMSSFLGFINVPFFGAYNASKHALEGLSDTLRMELCDTPIDIIILRPGPIYTKAQDNAFQKLEDNIDVQNSVYHKAYVILKKRYKAKQLMPPFAQHPNAVSQVVWRALVTQKPKAKYHITHLTRGFGLLKRILPEKLLTAIILKATHSQSLID